MSNSSTLQTFYASTPWRQFRLKIIQERGTICTKCHIHIHPSCNIELHHIIPLTERNYTDVNIALNPENVEVVCKGCHNIITDRFHNVKNVYVVYGAPFSGKSSYVNKRMNIGDLVVDMDLLYTAISGQPMYIKPQALLNNVIAVRNTLIDNIKTRYGKWGTAYIIGGYPLKGERERLCKELGAKLIYCEATIEECYNRLVISDRQIDIKEWQEYINKWFERYSP